MRVQDRSGLWKEAIDRQMDKRLGRRLSKTLQDLGVIVEFEKVRFIQLSFLESARRNAYP